MSTILVTGGSGYIGIHVCWSLLKSGYKLIVIDSSVNSNLSLLQNVLQIGLKENQDFSDSIFFEKGDIRDEPKLSTIFKKAKEKGLPIKAVIHLAGLKAVEESIRFPLNYWDSNVNGSIILFKVMEKYNCKTIIFSSSATIYGSSNIDDLINETSKISPINPYGETKAAIEKILSNLFSSDDKSWSIVNLRYFNPIGAHESGLIGESPNGIPNNLFPNICQVAAGKLEKIKIFGKNWPTKDGTCIRDFIHVMDLADAHKSALEFLISGGPTFVNINIGTGTGISVLELVNTFQEVNSCNLRYEFADPRKGDICKVVADNKLALSLLDWVPKKGIKDMCKEGWQWEKNKNNLLKNNNFGIKLKSLI